MPLSKKSTSFGTHVYAVPVSAKSSTSRSLATTEPRGGEGEGGRGEGGGDGGGEGGRGEGGGDGLGGEGGGGGEGGEGGSGITAFSHSYSPMATRLPQSVQSCEKHSRSRLVMWCVCICVGSI